MPRIRATFLIAMLLAGLSPGIVSAEEREETEGGIVGTGIVGTITELGSIYVNGQHILFDPDQTVASPLGDRPAASLVPGETVAVEAVRAADAWQALALRAYLPIVGPVASVEGRRLAALGAAIEIPAGVASVEQFVGEPVAAGDWIAVSGFWRGDTVVASRIEKIPAQPLASAVGTYRPSDEFDSVGAVRLIGVRLEHARPMDLLTVQGAPSTGGIAVEAVAIGLFTGPVGEVLFEGYLSQPNLQGAYTVQGSGFLAYADQPMTVDGSRALFCGVTGGVGRIERILDLPESTARRDDVLRAFRADAAPPCGTASR